MDARTTRLGVSLVLVVILAGLVALAPNGWWALGVFVVLIPVAFASLIWAAGQPVTPTAVVVGSTAMAAGVAAYLLVVLGLGRLMGPITLVRGAHRSSANRGPGATASSATQRSGISPCES